MPSLTNELCSVSVSGVFNAVGTADNPIQIFSSAQTSGSWDGIILSGTGDKRFSNISIVGGGLAGNTGAVEIDCTEGASFSVDMNNTFISGSNGWGIFAEGNTCTYNIDNTVTFSNNALGNINVP